MISLPFATLMFILAFVAVRYGPVKLSHLLLGMAVGLSMSGTAVGAMVEEMAATLTSAAIEAFSGLSTATAGPMARTVLAVVFGGAT